MLLWELAFERKPYESMDFEKIPNFVIAGGREAIIFDQSGLAPPFPSDAKIQKGFETIIRQGKLLSYKKNLFLFHFYYEVLK